VNRVKLVFPCLVFLFLSAALAQTAGGVTVTATGTAYGEPDEASFDAGVSALNTDVQVATTQVNERVSSLMAVLREAGVAERDIRTSSFTVYPEPAYGPNGQIRQMRYRVSNTIHVTVRDTAQLGALLGSSVEAGANEVSNVVYTFSDRSALERQAREQAMTRGRDKAEQLAQFGGAALGEVQRITEGMQSGGVAPFADFRVESMDAADASSEVPVSSGQLAVTVSVQVTFGLKQRSDE
jgi:uncharacterized protein YggE